ncbi:hypothetical protein F443_19739 [Phytophthora nicotianae P1569]|uniref:Uncharacterized protein n=1 Tax=Phytophthora nicotianae P1569 TaxID=1317065 RepID=V9E3B1_PHYNI|nr:hypothetical protein F443_19739 [Phytophthora nicotianae P1569]
MPTSIRTKGSTPLCHIGWSWRLPTYASPSDKSGKIRKLQDEQQVHLAIIGCGHRAAGASTSRRSNVAAASDAVLSVFQCTHLSITSAWFMHRGRANSLGY